MVQNHRLAVAALALALGIALVGCSSGSGKGAVSLKVPSGGAKTAPLSGAPGAVPTTGATTAGAAAGGSGTASTTPGTPTSKPGGTATTIPAHATTTAPAGTKTTTPAASGPAPAPVGTYTYSLVGTGSSTLDGKSQTVENTITLGVTTTGSRTEQWANPVTTLDLSFTNGGVYLLEVEVPLAGATCTFSSPVAYPPWPLKVTTVYGQASCGQGATLSLKEQVTGTASVTVHGAAVPTYVVTSTMTLSNTNLTVVETDSYAPSLRLPVKSLVAIAGSESGASIVIGPNTYLLA